MMIIIVVLVEDFWGDVISWFRCMFLEFVYYRVKSGLIKYYNFFGWVWVGISFLVVVVGMIGEGINSNCIGKY